MKWNTVLFDLDGTLTDPKEGITKAVAYALDSFGIHVEDRNTLTHYIGPPLEETFAADYGFSYEKAMVGVEKFREYYNVTGWKENVPYPGIEALLSALKAAGLTLLLATSKPEETANMVLCHFDLKKYFTVAAGANPQIPHSNHKGTIIRAALRRAGADAARAVMVGDRRHDTAGAHEAELPCIGVLYGYGSKEEHLACGTDFLAENLADLETLLLDKN